MSLHEQMETTTLAAMAEEIADLRARLAGVIERCANLCDRNADEIEPYNEYLAGCKHEAESLAISIRSLAEPAEPVAQPVVAWSNTRIDSAGQPYRVGQSTGATLPEQPEPVAWWRYEGDFTDKFEKGWFQRERPESNGMPLYAAPVEDAQDAERYRDLLMWLLWHHQGGSSPVGQPIRRVFGIGECDHLTEEQVTRAYQFDAAIDKARGKP